MRLIDAKKCPCYTCRTQCCENPMRCSFFGLWLQKQAYDVEAVVAKMEKESFEDSCGRAILLSDAEMIVRGEE